MPDYIDLNLTLDSDQLRQDGRDRITELAPAGYVVDPWIDWLLSAVARMAVEVAVLAGQVPLTIFTVFVSRVLGIPVLQATTATGTATFTVTDTTAERTVPEGTIIEIPDDSGEGTGTTFTTTVDLVFAISDPTSADVAIVAEIPGVAGTGLSGTAQLVSPTFVWVDSVDIVAPTDGGQDGETGQEYVDRVADELPTFSPKAILIEDFSAIARSDLEVFRALAIDNFVPPSSTGVAGAVTVALQDASGAAVSSDAKTRVENTLEANRVLNIDVHVIDPTFTRVDVDFTAHCQPGYDAAVVEAEGIAAIQSFLDPARWGTGPGGRLTLDAGGAAPTVWVDEPTLRRNDLFGVLYKVLGIRHVDTLTLALHGGSLATADITLTGPASLPASNSVVTGTVTA